MKPFSNVIAAMLLAIALGGVGWILEYLWHALQDAWRQLYYRYDTWRYGHITLTVSQAGTGMFALGSTITLHNGTPDDYVVTHVESPTSVRIKRIDWGYGRTP